MGSKFIYSMICAGLLSGCAGSASHRVVTAHQAGDTDLTCEQIDSEILKTQVIIDGVNQDKEDVSGADVVDGILWFPFNLIAKSANYSSSLEAADRRIENLQKISTQNECEVASVEDQEKALKQLTATLGELNDLYKSGALTDEEYKEAKQKVLDGVGT